MPIEVGGRRFYPIQVAEKGFEVYRIHVQGTWGHGSMPRDDNALVRAAEVVRRLASPGEPRITAAVRDVPRRGRRRPRRPTRPALIDAIGGDDPRRSEAAIRAALRPRLRPGPPRAPARHDQPDDHARGHQVQRHPGRGDVEIDCRTLPGHHDGDMREELLARIGDLAPHCELEHVIGAVAGRGAGQGDLYELLAATIRAHDPDGIPVPVMAPFATDAKHLLRLGVPTYGFSPLRLEPGERFLERFHGVDERVGLDALRLGPARPVRRGRGLLRLSRSRRLGRVSGARDGAALRRRGRASPPRRSSCSGRAGGCPRRSGSCCAASWCWRTSSISRPEPSLWRCSMRYCELDEPVLVHRHGCSVRVLCRLGAPGLSCRRGRAGHAG